MASIHVIAPQLDGLSGVIMHTCVGAKDWQSLHE